MRQAVPGPPPLPPRKLPVPDRRQAACTHTNVTRLYDRYGSYRCQICRRPPGIGWVYRCTQDHNGFLPESDFRATLENTTVVVKEERPVWLLKQWMYEAVLKGQYTVEQFSTLFQQRQGVKKAIFKSHSAATPLAGPSPGFTGNSADIINTTLTSIAASYSGDGSIVRSCENGLSCTVTHYESTPDEPVLDQPPINPIATGNKRPWPSYLACTWTCCQSCRPTYRDRAWQSLDAAVREPTRTPPVWELENRPISDARIVAKMGVQKLNFPSEVDDLRYESSSEAPLSSCSNLAESEPEILDYGGLHGIRTKGSLRATFKRTWMGAVGHKRSTSGESQTSSNNSSHSSLKRWGRPILFGSRRSSQSTDGYSPRTVEDGQLQESLMLMLAVNTPLPDAAASVEDLHDGEVEVEDGVAVTEEGISMSAADIIIQV